MAVNRKAVRWVSIEESRPSVTRFWRDSLPCAGVLYHRCSLTGRGARGRGSSPAVRPLLGGLRDRPRAACGPRALGRSSKASKRPGEGVRPGAGTPEGLRPRPCPAGTVLEPSIPPGLGSHSARSSPMVPRAAPPSAPLPAPWGRGLCRLRGHQGLCREMPWGIVLWARPPGSQRCPPCPQEPRVRWCWPRVPPAPAGTVASARSPRTSRASRASVLQAGKVRPPGPAACLGSLP